MIQNLPTKQTSRVQKALTVFGCVWLALLVYVPSRGIAATEDVVIQAVVAGAPEENAGGGGGGSSSSVEEEPFMSPSSVFFSGIAYPSASVFLLKNGQETQKTTATDSALFSLNITDLTPGSYTFSVVAEDPDGYRSTLRTFPLRVLENVTTNISDILIAPTIRVNTSSLMLGDPLVVSGYGAPTASVLLSLKSLVSSLFSVPTLGNGSYTKTFDTTGFSLGKYTLSGHTVFLDERQSSESALTSFVVSDTALPLSEETYTASDINYDMRVNLVDFSILAYWYKKDAPPLKVDLNGDGRVTITDFSILAYAWTG